MYQALSKIKLLVYLAVNLSMFSPGIRKPDKGNFLRAVVMFVGGKGILISIALWNIFAVDGNTIKRLMYLKALKVLPT